jgi:hypothetical protein
LVAHGAPVDKVARTDESDDTAPAAPGSPPSRQGPVAYPDPIVLRDLSGTRLAIETAVHVRAEQLRSARAAASAQVEPGAG